MTTHNASFTNFANRLALVETAFSTQQKDECKADDAARLQQVIFEKHGPNGTNVLKDDEATQNLLFRYIALYENNLIKLQNPYGLSDEEHAVSQMVQEALITLKP